LEISGHTAFRKDLKDGAPDAADRRDCSILSTFARAVSGLEAGQAAHHRADLREFSHRKNSLQEWVASVCTLLQFQRLFLSFLMVRLDEI
jgi:hypothetical protein